jgi:hypothetical protein
MAKLSIAMITKLVKIRDLFILCSFCLFIYSLSGALLHSSMQKTFLNLLIVSIAISADRQGWQLFF